MSRSELFAELLKSANRSDSLLRDLHEDHSRLLKYVQTHKGICAQEQEGDTSLADVIIRYLESELEKEFEPLHCDFCNCVVTDPWHGSGVHKGKVHRHLHACDDCRPKLPAVDFRYVWLDTMGGFSNSWNMLNPTGPLSLEALQTYMLACPENDTYKLIEYRCLSHPDFEFMNLMKLR